VKQVAHRIDENGAGLAPTQGEFQSIGMQRYVKSIAILGIAHPLETTGQPFRITPFATGTNFAAAGNRIPGSIRPFYFAADGHDLPILQQVVGDLHRNVSAGGIGGSEHESK
jgi:hypothetical protein